MAEYIERDEAIRKAQDACIKIVFRILGRGITQFDAADIVDVMESVPTADVVEVVRCKDCVNYCGFEHCKNGICDVDVVSKRAVYPDDFCSYGERKGGSE
jgi:hypothetical protein